MKFFVDSAEVSEIGEIVELGLADGVTTNPSLLAKTGRPYATVLREKGIAGTPQMVTERLKQLRDEAHLAGVSAEINPGSMLSHEQVMSSLRLYIQEVMPHFK